jgi:hypothetical protein
MTRWGLEIEEHVAKRHSLTLYDLHRQKISYSIILWCQPASPLPTSGDLQSYPFRPGLTARHLGTRVVIRESARQVKLRASCQPQTTRPTAFSMKLNRPDVSLVSQPREQGCNGLRRSPRRHLRAT